MFFLIPWIQYFSRLLMVILPECAERRLVLFVKKGFLRAVPAEKVFHATYPLIGLLRL